MKVLILIFTLIAVSSTYPSNNGDQKDVQHVSSKKQELGDPNNRGHGENSTQSTNTTANIAPDDRNKNVTLPPSEGISISGNFQFSNVSSSNNGPNTIYKGNKVVTQPGELEDLKASDGHGGTLMNTIFSVLLG